MFDDIADVESQLVNALNIVLDLKTNVLIDKDSDKDL
jgi:hypothetical protein